MNPWLSVWLLSLTGAALFFTGGGLWMRLRTQRVGSRSVSRVANELHATRAHMLEQERMKRKLRESQHQLVHELSRSQLELQKLNVELMTVRRGTRNPLACTQDEFVALQSELTQLRHDCTLQARELTRAERTAASSSAELRQLEARVAELSKRSTTHETQSTLERELSATRTALQTRDEELERLRASNARSAAAEAELAEAKLEVARLQRQSRGQRPDALNALNKQGAARKSERARSDMHASALQALVEHETESGRAESAVIADELGLLVVGSGVAGETGEALAALGAYLADLGSKTRDVLPLRELRQVVVRDDRDTTLTVQLLAADDPGLALVTLAMTGATKPPAIA